ncbi:MAG TPA: TMEM175 family protein [Sphingorhabdus sp.]|jgi:uncharacterized membrane protein|nr:TMEM175 family protein [Sphingorhabdus sp.]
MSNLSARIDAFTDAAFAFALSLMVVGTGGAAPDYANLLVIIRTIPSFAIGFAIIAMFWIAHVRWRQFRGEGDWRSVSLTILLVFTVLVYVHPLKAMAVSFAAFLGGEENSYGPHIAEMFTIYGVGFVIMALITSALFRDALRNPALPAGERNAVKGEAIIWLILVGTGVVSTVMTLFPAIALFAPSVYATLPVTVGLFVAWWDWDGEAA